MSYMGKITYPVSSEACPLCGNSFGNHVVSPKRLHCGECYVMFDWDGNIYPDEAP